MRRIADDRPPFNRTRLELKRDGCVRLCKSYCPFNRTRLELKPDKVSVKRLKMNGFQSHQIGIETLTVIPNSWSFFSFNRTRLELKRFQWCGERRGVRTFNRTRLELKLGNDSARHVRAVPFNRTRLELKRDNRWRAKPCSRTFNRTRLELKLGFCVFSAAITAPSFNRTRLELKRSVGDALSARHRLSIAPDWNWNLVAVAVHLKVYTPFNRTRLELKLLRTPTEIDCELHFQSHQIGIETREKASGIWNYR